MSTKFKIRRLLPPAEQVDKEPDQEPSLNITRQSNHDAATVSQASNTPPPPPVDEPPRLRESWVSTKTIADGTNDSNSGTSSTKNWVRLKINGADPKTFVGLQCKVWWPADDAWYHGRVIRYDSERKQHHVAYEDGDQENFNLSKGRIKFYISPEEMRSLGLSYDLQHSHTDELNVDMHRLRESWNCTKIGNGTTNTNTSASFSRRWVELEFNDVDPKIFVGLQCKVYWPADAEWYLGRVVRCYPECDRHHVLYEDGDEEILNLSKERIKFYISHEEMCSRRLNLLADDLNVDGPQLRKSQNCTNTGNSIADTSTSPSTKRKIRRINVCDASRTKRKIKRINVCDISRTEGASERDLESGVDMYGLSHHEVLRLIQERTRINGKLKKLQDLVPNMDKQTSCADMLDLAVQHIKGLQTQVQGFQKIGPKPCEYAEGLFQPERMDLSRNIQRRRQHLELLRQEVAATKPSTNSFEFMHAELEKLRSDLNKKKESLENEYARFKEHTENMVAELKNMVMVMADAFVQKTGGLDIESQP